MRSDESKLLLDQRWEKPIVKMLVLNLLGDMLFVHSVYCLINFYID